METSYAKASAAAPTAKAAHNTYAMADDIDEQQLRYPAVSDTSYVYPQSTAGAYYYPASSSNLTNTENAYTTAASSLPANVLPYFQYNQQANANPDWSQWMQANMPQAQAQQTAETLVDLGLGRSVNNFGGTSAESHQHGANDTAGAQVGGMWPQSIYGMGGQNGSNVG